MLFSRYHGCAQHLLSSDFEDGFEMYVYAEKQRQEEILKQRWILHYQDKMSFYEFKDELAKPQETIEEKEIVQVLTDLRQFFG